MRSRSARPCAPICSRTELEKSLQEHGAAPDPVPPLPECYLREVEDPAAAYAAHRVRVALLGARVVGVVVLSVRDEVAEVKRLWAELRRAVAGWVRRC